VEPAFWPPQQYGHLAIRSTLFWPEQNLSQSFPYPNLLNKGRFLWPVGGWISGVPLYFETQNKVNNIFIELV